MYVPGALVIYDFRNIISDKSIISIRFPVNCWILSTLTFHLNNLLHFYKLDFANSYKKSVIDYVCYQGSLHL